MELISINLARAVALLEVESLDPRGRKTAPENIKILAEKFGFAKVPETFAELDFQKGVEFFAGHFDSIAIQRLGMFANGIVVDTRSSTEDSAAVLADILEFAKKELGASMKMARHHFISQLVFRSDLDISLLVNPILKPILARVSQAASAGMNYPFVYAPTSILMGVDMSQAKLAPNQFSIERRAETPFSENLYFSASPLQTSEHIRALEEIERALKK